MKRTLSSITLALVAAAFLAGCGSSSNTPSSTNVAFNTADVTFVQSMIPHHEQAVVMAKMATSRASSTAVKQVAAKIEAAQAPEITEMTGWLKAWGKDTGSGSSGHDMSDMGGNAMPGMMSDTDMATLAKSNGSAFDQMFLTMMIRHHQGAIDMAKTEQMDGKSPDAIRLAKQIAAAQTAEITLMTSLLNSLP